jgi:hypothetical protein
MQSTCAVLSPVASPTLPYFATLSQKQHGFLKKDIEHKMYCDFFIKLMSKTFV